VAGESTCVQLPELDVCFDMGECPRTALASKFVCISHGHMDHIGALAYWCSQRNFQGMGPGTVVCDARIAPAIDAMLKSFHPVEQQTTPYNLIALEPNQEIEIKNSVVLRAFETEHTAPSFGYAIVEKRSKLRDEYVGLPQEKLRELKDRGEEITRILEVPLVAYLGDTAPGPALIRPDVLNAQIVISECSFIDADHKDRAKIGKHLHIDDVAEWLRVLRCKDLVLIHVSRRSNIALAQKRLREVVSREQADRVHFLMDHRTNKMRYERQLMDAERQERMRQRSGPGPGVGAGQSAPGRDG
jgi:ribonuclease Z